MKEKIIAKEPKLKDALKNVQIIALTRGEHKRRVEIHKLQEEDESTADGPYFSFVDDPYVEKKKVASSKTAKKGTTKKRKAKEISDEDEEVLDDISDDEDGWDSDMESEEYGYDNNDEVFEYDRPSRACDKPSGFYDEDASEDGMEDDEFPEDEPNDSIDDYFDDIVTQMKKSVVFE